MKCDGTIRGSGDYKLMVNTVTKTDSYPSHREHFVSLSNGKCFSNLDLLHTYLHFPHDTSAITSLGATGAGVSGIVTLLSALISSNIYTASYMAGRTPHSCGFDACPLGPFSHSQMISLLLLGNSQHLSHSDSSCLSGQWTHEEASRGGTLPKRHMIWYFKHLLNWLPEVSFYRLVHSYKAKYHE